MSDRDLKLDECAAPVLHEGVVKPEWIDVNGHMNVAFYMVAMDEAIDALWHSFGLTNALREETGSSTFAVECHIRYLSELMLDEPFAVAARILAFDEKRLHQYQYLFSARTGRLSATCEWMHLHVNLNHRGVSPWPGVIVENLKLHPAGLVTGPWPEAVGAQMRVRKPLGPTTVVAAER
ncbi:MAG: thioesterase family protein [Pseudomonadota bacterium]